MDRSKLGAGVLYGNPNCDYVAEITIDDGNYRVIMDSGSSFLAVAGLGCACGTASRYWAGGSSSSFVASYGSGNLQGGVRRQQRRGSERAQQTASPRAHAAPCRGDWGWGRAVPAGHL